MMLTLAKIVLISTLLISLSFGSNDKQNPERNTTQSIIEKFKMMENKSIPLERKTHVTSENEIRNVPTPTTDGSPLLELSNAYETINSTNSLQRGNTSEGLRPTSSFSTGPPLAHGFVSKLPLNLSISDDSPLPVSAHPNSTHEVSSENSTSSLNNDTMKIPDNHSSTLGDLPQTPTSTPVVPVTVKPTEWLTTVSASFARFTPYQEKTTLQPTIKFTNNSKIYPNTSDTQKENRSTGIVFGAILGAILGASFLSLAGYLLCGKRKTDSFSHRRLYDDRNEPVLRLDNAPEPYDVNFGNSSYYNPTVNDASMPEGGEHLHDGIPMDDIPPLRTSTQN